MFVIELCGLSSHAGLVLVFVIGLWGLSLDAGLVFVLGLCGLSLDAGLVFVLGLCGLSLDAGLVVLVFVLGLCGLSLDAGLVLVFVFGLCLSLDAGHGAWMLRLELVLWA